MKIGIIGGGQLGMMMAQAALSMQHEVLSLDPNSDASITHYTTKHYATSFDDLKALHKLFSTCDVLTYEFENIPVTALKLFQAKLPQGLLALEVSQHRFNEKSFASNIQIPTPKFLKVSPNTPFSGKGILKTQEGGYDGKGQVVINNKMDWQNATKEQMIFEEYVAFDYEISIVASRDRKRNIVFYPTIQNIHRNGILHISKIVGDVPASITQKAQRYTRLLLENLDYIGTFAVEYFVVGDEVVFNEFAPRPHNSGHFSIDACMVSQFENHIEAITGGQVKEPNMQHSAIMVNVLGQDNRYVDNALTHKIGCVHDYKKIERRLNRKMGHITIIGNKRNLDEQLKLVLGETT